MLVVDGFEPFVGHRAWLRILDLYMDSEMLEPAVGLCAMPMLYAFGNVHDVASLQWNSGFAPFLVSGTTRYADQNLACAMMDVPVVAATWFEGDIGKVQNALFISV